MPAVCEIARDAGIPAVAIVRKDFESDAAYSDAIFTEVAPYDPTLMILAGFLRKIVVPPEWEGRILNIHPALLPECDFAAGRGFYGDRVHRAVLESGQTRSGATVHLVDNGYDTGPVYMRQSVPIEPGDTVETLAARVFRGRDTSSIPRAIAAYLAVSLRVGSLANAELGANGLLIPGDCSALAELTHLRVRVLLFTSPGRNTLKQHIRLAVYPSRSA